MKKLKTMGDFVVAVCAKGLGGRGSLVCGEVVEADSWCGGGMVERVKL